MVKIGHKMNYMFFLLVIYLSVLLHLLECFTDVSRTALSRTDASRIDVSRTSYTKEFSFTYCV